MKLTGVLGDDRAVSPVIGTILMVAITVILAAVIGAAVFGVVGNIGDTAPQATFNWHYNNSTSDTLTVQHAGGEAIDRSKLSLETRNMNVYILYYPPASTEGVYPVNYTGQPFNDAGTTVQAGDSATITRENTTYNPSNYKKYQLRLNASHVNLIWNDGKRSVILSSWSGPDAKSS